MKAAHAVVVLPPGGHGRHIDGKQKRWLSRGRVDFAAPRTEMLESVLSVIAAPAPDGGLAALRFWGQTGERSAAWMAAADPVHLETRLRDLRVRALSPDQVLRKDLVALFETLRAELGGDGDFVFDCLGSFGYVRGEHGFATPSVSAAVADGHLPDRYSPAGDAARTYHRLLGELQILLHEHAVNRRRARAGLLTVNSLWFWGGGVAPEQAERPLPPLFSNDPLFKGYWASCSGTAEAWPGDFEQCLAVAPRGFVAVTPETTPDQASDFLADCLMILARHMKRGELNSLTLLFRDGLRVTINRMDRVRFWRRTSALFEADAVDD